MPEPDDIREDIRDIPLVTCDPVDARDFDDAVFAEPDTDLRTQVVIILLWLLQMWRIMCAADTN